MSPLLRGVLLFFLLPVLACPSLCQADDAGENSPLATLRDYWTAARYRVQQPINQSYRDDLRKLSAQYTKAGRVTDALAVEKELESSEERPGDPDGLAARRNVWRNALRRALHPIDRRYELELEKLAERYRKAGQLNELAAVTEAQKELKGEQEKEEAPRKGLHVLEATFGLRDQRVDVTEVLNELIDNDKLRLVANKDFLGVDPAPGEFKELIIRYTFNGEEHERTFISRDKVRLP